ncbi:hypothetical protein [Lignipirellula cremea]|uniref:Uncharacterized protein n=1 Tax=Lignipirellula cremea TaxID=2528010 RepID=A0A518DY69_9BACT|nr:hypothetical protein [Lignipirellula cremea]QDU96790.1 hypothetical protein Pla8534_46110 [Lignipirellula cremea]
MKILVRPLVLLVMTAVFAVASQSAEAGFFKKHFGCKKKCSSSCEEEAEPTCECTPEPTCECTPEPACGECAPEPTCGGCTPEPACPTCSTGTVIYSEPAPEPAPMPMESDAPAPPPVDMSTTSSGRVYVRTVSNGVVRYRLVQTRPVPVVSHRSASIRPVSFRR